MVGKRSIFQALGTEWDIQVQTTITDIAWTRLLNRLHERIETFDRAYSRFRADSLVTNISLEPGRYDIPADGLKLLNFYHKLYLATHGRVTPLIGRTMVEAGYDASYSLRKQRLHYPPRWEDVLVYDHASITTNRLVLLDFGAAGKGYLVDIIGKILEEYGIETYVINAGGDMRHRSKQDEAVAVGLENPLDFSEALGIAKLSNSSLCASAGNKRKWSDMHHMINPITLESPTEIIATWVTAADTMTADGLATALFFTDPSQLVAQFDFSYVVLHTDMSLEHSRNFPMKTFETA